MHLKSQATGQDESTADVRLIVVQISQVSLVVTNHVGGGTTAQAFTTPFGPGALQWPAAIWMPPSAAVLVSSSIPSFTLNAVSTPAANDPDVLGWITFDATHRAPDDTAQAQAVAGGSFVVTGSPTGTATVSGNLAGSFQILVCVDANLNNQCDPGETGITMPVILVQATLHKNLSGVVPVNAQTDPGGYVNYFPLPGTWTQSGVQAGSGFACGQTTTYLQFYLSYCAVLLAAEVDLLGGGGDGTRGVGQVYAGWVQDAAAPTSIKGTYSSSPPTVSHYDTYIFASNGSATHDNGYFYPNPPSNDPPPIMLAGPLLDTNQANPGTGGNSSLLATSTQTANAGALQFMDPDLDPAPSVGLRTLVAAGDAPEQVFFAADPAYTGFQLTGIQFSQTFVGYLALWSSITGVPPGPVGPPSADRTYGVLLEQPWNVNSMFSIDPHGVGTLTTALPGIYLSQVLATVHSPTTGCPACALVAITATNAVPTPPTAAKSVAEDLRQ